MVVTCCNVLHHQFKTVQGTQVRYEQLQQQWYVFTYLLLHCYHYGIMHLHRI
jgi:hypothetical protein